MSKSRDGTAVACVKPPSFSKVGGKYASALNRLQSLSEKLHLLPSLSPTITSHTSERVPSLISSCKAHVVHHLRSWIFTWISTHNTVVAAMEFFQLGAHCTSRLFFSNATVRAEGRQADRNVLRRFGESGPKACSCEEIDQKEPA